jgi:uncharacterized repeat protein (TIGR01451 family)
MRNLKRRRKKNIVFLLLAIFFVCTFRINLIAKAEIPKETGKIQTPTNSETITPEKNTENNNTEDNAIEEPKSTGDLAGNALGDSVTITASSGVSYTLDFSAYDPLYYNFKLPINYAVPPMGRADDPMPGANGSHPRLESLEPRELALGQIVPYEVEITVKGNTAEEGTTINFTNLWSTITTSGDDFGFDPKYKVFAAFVDYGDTRNLDNSKEADAKISSSQIVGKDIKGTFEVSGLNDGDRIIVEIWLVLKSELPTTNVTGNVQANLDSAKTSTGETISTGNQTVPLNQVGKFTTVTADVAIVKSDSPDPIYSRDTLTYTITVTNNSADVVANGIAVTDTLDPNVTFVSASEGGTLSGSVITWPAFALEPKSQRGFTVTVKVNADAPTEIYKGTTPHTGSASAVRFVDADITNIVKFSMITQDSNVANNVWQEPTNVLPRASFTAYKVWVGGPAADHNPVELILYRQVGTGEKEVVTGVKPIITTEAGTPVKFTYTWSGLPIYSPDLQPYVYTVDEAVAPKNYSKSITENTITNTYKPSLTIKKVHGTTPLSGAEFALYKGNSSGRTGEPLKTITTGSDGVTTFGHLEDGTYWVVETKPPFGYKWIDDIGPFTVSNAVITGPSGYTPTADGETGNYIITVQNQPVRALPATGGVGTIPFLISGLGLMIFALSLERRKKVN